MIRKDFKTGHENTGASEETVPYGGHKARDIPDENGLFRLIENTDIGRIQFDFDGRPEDRIRTILKANGFRWSPKQGRWQRKLTDEGRWAAEKAALEIRKLREEKENA